MSSGSNCGIDSAMQDAANGDTSVTYVEGRPTDDGCFLATDSVPDPEPGDPPAWQIGLAVQLTLAAQGWLLAVRRLGSPGPRGSQRASE